MTYNQITTRLEADLAAHEDYSHKAARVLAGFAGSIQRGADGCIVVCPMPELLDSRATVHAKMLGGIQFVKDSGADFEQAFADAYCEAFEVAP